MSKRKDSTPTSNPQESDHKRSDPSILKIATGVFLGILMVKVLGILLIVAFVLLILTLS